MFTFSQSSGNSGITEITISATSRQELTDLVEDFTLSNQTKSLLMPIAQRAYEPVEKYIIMSPSAITWDSSGGTASLNIQSNDNWTIVASGWIRLSRYEEHRTLDLETPNTLSGNGNTIIGISCVENLGEARNGGITAYCQSDSSITATTTVSQAGNYVKPYIVLGQYQYSVSADGVTGATLAVSSNTEWNTSSNAIWITINTVSGSNNGTISFDVAESDQSIDRTGSIYVSGITDDVSASCVVTQSANTQEPYIIISPENKKSDITGETFVITVSSNTSWDVTIYNQSGESGRSWVNVDKLNGYGDDEIVVTVNPMLDGYIRKCYISITNRMYNLEAICNIKQSEFSGNKIFYTSTDGNIINPNNPSLGSWYNNLVDNTYEDGQGILWFTGTVYSIPNNTFSGQTRLLTIDIPDSVIRFGMNSFKGCTALTGTIEIPESTYQIGADAFSNCFSLTGFSFKSTIIKEIEHYTFYNCSGITGNISMPSVKKVNNNAFRNCHSLTSVTFGNSLSGISQDAFLCCDGLVSVTFPENSYVEIGKRAFSGCTSLTGELIFNNGPFISSAMSISANAFTDTAFTAATFKDNDYLFGEGILENSKVRQVAFNTSIPTGTCRNCTSLTSIILNSSATSISQFAFENATGLTDIYAFRTSPPLISNNSFSNISPTGTLHYPRGSNYSSFMQYLPSGWTSVENPVVP